MARNEWFTAVEQTLPEYVPLPMDRLFQAGQLIQNRFDTNMQNIDAVGTGLSSIEARLPGHREYVNNLATNYREQTSNLLDKYNGNASDPQFQREFNRIKNTFTNDRNLSTILMANEAAKRNEGIAAQLAAEGKLYINPQTTGLDSNGNLISDVGQIRQVNTLDEWANRLKIAAGTQTEVGDLITNRPSLETARNQIQSAIEAGSPEVLDLVNAYQTRGLNQAQAISQVAQDAQRLSGQYAISEETNWRKKSYELDQQRLAEQRLARIAAQRQAQEAQGVPNNSGLYFVPTAERQGNAVIAQSSQAHNLQIPIAGRSNVNFNTPFKGNLPAGERFVYTSGTFSNGVYKKSGTTNIKDGTFIGAEVPYVINSVFDVKSGKNSTNKSYTKKVGRMVTKDEGFWTSFGGSDGNVDDTNIYTDQRGDFVYMDKDKTVKGYVQPQAFGVYRDNESDAIIYRKLNRDEAMQYLGADAGRFSNQGYSANEYQKAANSGRGATLNNISNSFRQRYGRNPNEQELNENWIKFRDLEEYQSRIQNRLSKPSTTTPVSEFYNIGN